MKVAEVRRIVVGSNEACVADPLGDEESRTLEPVDLALNRRQRDSCPLADSAQALRALTAAPWVQRTSFAMIYRPGIGTACVVGDSITLRHSWYAFVFCAPGSTRIMPRHTAVACSRSAPLNAKSLMQSGAMCSWKVS